MNNLLIELVGCRMLAATSEQLVKHLLVYFVLEMTSPSNSVKYGRSSRRNRHRRTKFSREWYADSSPPNSSDSLVILRADRFSVDYHSQNLRSVREGGTNLECELLESV
jgi:hypothetical protein